MAGCGVQDLTEQGIVGRGNIVRAHAVSLLAGGAGGGTTGEDIGYQIHRIRDIDR
jgi:hypothetical protein